MVGWSGIFVAKVACAVRPPRALDIVVVKQPDGSFKSSPWCVRFRMVQRFLEAKEEVKIRVNGVEANFHMYLNKREPSVTHEEERKAYFLGEGERSRTPTSEQLASLNLQDGRNEVTFRISPPMLGKQEVDATIHLWKWNARIVISDIDGTITKSPNRGQLLALAGINWLQKGVVDLFSAIKENGYQLLYLTTRPITLDHQTRSFLFHRLEQDGKTLPDGPVVMSPDGVSASFFQEFVNKDPHNLKTAWLKLIKRLFPDDCQPFYAGFGDKDTDKISYEEAGIPEGKIYIINPEGRSAGHRTRLYYALHDHVHEMFPSTRQSAG